MSLDRAKLIPLSVTAAGAAALIAGGLLQTNAMAAPRTSSAATRTASITGTTARSAVGSAGSAGSATGSTAVAAVTTATSRAGCTPNSTKIPAGADRVKTVDVDGDGRADTLFINQDKSVFGVRTASGRTIVTRFSTAEASDLGVEAVNLVHGNTVILLAGSRTTKLYAVTDCKIVVTRNKQRNQYTFDNGFVTWGTGVGCTTSKAGHTLVGLAARKMGMSGNTYEIHRTPIILTHHGRDAKNGTDVTSNPNLSRSAAWKKVQTSFPCGPHKAVAGS